MVLIIAEIVAIAADNYTLSLAVQCIVVGPVCVLAMGGWYVFVGVWMCVFVGLLPR